MHVFLTGATGYVGSYVLRALLDRGHTVRCLVREGSLGKLDIDPGRIAEVDSSQESVMKDIERGDEAGAARSSRPVEVVYGDVTDLSTVQGDMRGCDAVVHLVGIIEEVKPKGVTFERLHVKGTRTIVEEAKAAGITRFVHMSANGASPDADSAYQTTKWRAEEIVRDAGFASYVIFRPSILFGDPEPGPARHGREEFAGRLAESLIRRFPVLPILGDGQYRLQPVHVTAVADAFVQALDREPPSDAKAYLRQDAYCVAGHDVVTFDEAVDRITRALGQDPKPKLHQPLWLSKFVVGTAGEVGLLPISPAQFKMLIAGNTCDAARFWADFDVRPVPFTPEHLAYVREAES